MVDLLNKSQNLKEQHLKKPSFLQSDLKIYKQEAS
jgi:hypothetical protein